MPADFVSETQYRFYKKVLKLNALVRQPNSHGCIRYKNTISTHGIIIRRKHGVVLALFARFRQIDDRVYVVRRASHVARGGVRENLKITTCPRVFSLGIPICALKCRAYVQNFVNNYRGPGILAAGSPYRWSPFDSRLKDFHRPERTPIASVP